MNQALIPLAFQAVAALLQYELRLLAGRRYARGEGLPGHVRWSHERGSIYLADQKLGMVYPRVRNRQTNTEVPLQELRANAVASSGGRGRTAPDPLRLSCRDYRVAAEAIPEAFGLSRSARVA